MTVVLISPRSLDEICRNGKHVDLIDVRMPAEFREVHAEIARNVPLDSLNPKSVMEGRNGNSEEPLYVICQSGTRAAKACEKFQAAGYQNVISVEGGTRGWDAIGLSVIRGKKTISLERQVRIAAGSLVLLGVALSYWVHPGFVAISAFVGAGLVFAGVTDTCGMGMMLSKMPWNQVRESCCTSSDSQTESKGEESCKTS